jgi:hypothetical protein
MEQMRLNFYSFDASYRRAALRPGTRGRGCTSRAIGDRQAARRRQADGFATIAPD